MFGISMPEITVILIIAIIVLGPEKLPKVLVELAKYFKVIKKTINDAKSSFDQELRIAELKEDAKKYKESITQASEGVRKKLTFEELDEIKGGIDSVKETLNAGLKNIEGSVKDTLNSAEVSAQKQSETANLKANSSGGNSAQSSGAANSAQGSAGGVTNSSAGDKGKNSSAESESENSMPSAGGGAENSAQNTNASGEAKSGAENLNANLNGDAQNSMQNSAQNNEVQKS
ncbi:Sec-independent protein translocase protein TatB [uncultured Campylobacter sp.]|uniref:Sec-independent protein translocase protein TatB n=1 Tax=uncultured Campylobacter sp. TaxID=218934 RepID=UPI0026030DF6|nr:Sec-independent protein translocase protein TatB [uncultured Campylobacter sp.]